MMSKGSNFFTVMVIGDDPEKMMENYNMDLEVEKYLKYQYLNADKMQKNSLKILQEIINNPKNFNLGEFYITSIKNEMNKIKKMTSFEYYTMVTCGLIYDENGDAWDNTNPNGKWLTFRIGANLALPLKLKNGEEVYSAISNEIDWDRMHMNNTHVYETVWEMIKEGRTPETKEEILLYENMKDKENYFLRFKSKEEYVTYNCAYWNYAILTKDGWFDMDDKNNETEWITSFYDNFIASIKPSDKITIYECSRLDSTI